MGRDPRPLDSHPVKWFLYLYIVRSLHFPIITAVCCLRLWSRYAAAIALTSKTNGHQNTLNSNTGHDQITSSKMEVKVEPSSVKMESLILRLPQEMLECVVLHLDPVSSVNLALASRTVFARLEQSAGFWRHLARGHGLGTPEWCHETPRSVAGWRNLYRSAAAASRAPAAG